MYIITVMRMIKLIVNKTRAITSFEVDQFRSGKYHQGHDLQHGVHHAEGISSPAILNIACFQD